MNPVSPVLPGYEQIPEKVYKKEGCTDLPTVEVPGPEGEVISRWKLTDNEIALLVNGADVYLSVKTYNHGFPPVMLRVATADMVMDETRRVEFTDRSGDADVKVDDSVLPA